MKKAILLAAASMAIGLAVTACGTQNNSTSAPQTGNPAGQTSTTTTTTAGGTTGQGSNTTNPQSQSAAGSSSAPASNSQSGSSSGLGSSQTASPSGSSNSSPSSTPSSTPTSTPSKAPYSLSGKYSMGSKLYTVQGTIVQVNQTADVLESIVLKVTKNVIGADTSVNNPNYPIPLGSNQEFKFEENKSDRSNIHPQVGDNISLTCGQFEVTKNAPLVWGSNLQWYSTTTN